ncbi:hypothetical protein THII_0661 [Thioploca ingrica]|uniref:Uncharacterized protein n=1 Tax=Thioploca ingrica TaxID=40754 RepID=A0A090ABH2_9GAMM|nr:hypothetical protein THII_0661 [Thioploca ingrica]
MIKLSIKTELICTEVNKPMITYLLFKTIQANGKMESRGSLLSYSKSRKFIKLS